MRAAKLQNAPYSISIIPNVMILLDSWEITRLFDEQHRSVCLLAKIAQNRVSDYFA